MNVMGDVIFEEGGGTPVGRGGLRFFPELCSPSAGEGSAQQWRAEAAAAPQQKVFFHR